MVYQLYLLWVQMTLDMHMCTSTASYTDSEGDYKYIIDSMNTAYVYLAMLL